jgi:hypothetical protein
MRHILNISQERKRKRAGGCEGSSMEEYLKQLPSPTEEDAHELKMEKRLKRIIKEQEKK